MKKLLVLLMLSFSSIGGLMFLQQEEGGKLIPEDVNTSVVRICDCKQL